MLSKFAPGVVLMFLTSPSFAAPDIENGRAVYNFNCYFCHGYSGDADTLASTMLSPPPRDFTGLDPAQWDPAAMAGTVRKGRPGTAMPAFGARLTDDDIRDVVAFVGATFIGPRSPNLLYHSPENGWSSSQFESPAADFVTGQVSLSQPQESLSPRQLQGRQIYLGSCVSCHDNVAAQDDAPVWQSRSVSYPRGHYSHKDPASATTGASPYSQHDEVPVIHGMDARQQAGQRLFQANCAFCHAADGTGENWIGSFLEPKPRNLGGATVRAMDDRQLAERIAEGLPATSMPSWRHVLSADEIHAIVAYIRVAFQDKDPAAGSAGK